MADEKPLPNPLAEGAQAARPPLAEWNAEEAELLRGLFLEEADDHLRHIGEAQQALTRASEAASVDTEAVDGLFRHLHTLKGAAGSVGFEAIAHAAHDLEGLCAEIRAGRLAPTPGILERIDDGVASLRALQDGARAAPARHPSPSGRAPFAERRRNDRRELERRQGPERTVRVESDRLDALLDAVGDLVILRTRVERRLREIEGVLRDLHATRASLRAALGRNEAIVMGTLGGSPYPPAIGSGGDDRARRQDGALPPAPDADGSLLDRITEVELELTDSIAYLERATNALGAENESLRRTSDDLEDQVRRARLVPLEWLFTRLESALREIERAPEIGDRKADIAFAGASIELDKGVVAELTDPLLHLLRNSVAHGIESTALRLGRGKPPRARVYLSARHEGEFVFITFEDDGRGIDRQRVRDTLVRAGRLRPEEPLSEDRLVAALFEPGFSTRQESDALAGRGMGLDIVKKALVRLGGDVRIESHEGDYTRFHLWVPLTAAITQALLFKVGGQVYAVPAAHVVQALPLGPEDAPRGHSEAVANLPVLRLQSLLGVEMPPGRRAAALHVRYGDRSFVMTCDKIVGPRTIVVRPLGPLVGQLNLYAGVTVSGAGKAQLVLDLGVLAEAAHAPGRLTTAPLRRGQPRVLVVDDSRLAREASARVLAAAGYHPITAEDGWEAWELLGERRFDAVVTDLEMPRLDGFQLVARIRGEATLRGLPVLVLSSRTSDSVRDRALAAGAHVVLPKAPNKRGLVEALTALLDRGRRDDNGLPLDAPVR